MALGVRMILFSKKWTWKNFPPLFVFLFSIRFLAEAHEPIFMMSPEAPGKGAKDVHIATHVERSDEENALEQELDFSYGITRNFAVRWTLPFKRTEKETDRGQVTTNGFSDPGINLKWRFWDWDRLGEKYAAAVAVRSTIPVGDSEGFHGRTRPSLLFGISQGREGLKGYYFLDARYQLNVADEGSKPGDRLFLDAAYGLRPRLARLEETDVVLFLEVNVLHEFKTEVGGVEENDSGGDFFFLSPEILIAPNNRYMFKGGVQIPMAQERNGTAPARGFTTVAELEIRF